MSEIDLQTIEYLRRRARELRDGDERPLALAIELLLAERSQAPEASSNLFSLVIGGIFGLVMGLLTCLLF